VGEESLYGAGVLDGGEDAQPAATAGTGEDIEIEQHVRCDPTGPPTG
jgi:hypothetical protein